MKISYATIGDLNELAILFDLYRVFYGQKSDPIGAKLFLEERINKQDSIILIAKTGNDLKNKVAGFAQMYPLYSSVLMSKTLRLNDLYVLEDERRKGISSQLLLNCKEFAISIGAKRITLSTEMPNLIAQQIYESLGYKKDLNYFYYYLDLL